MKEGDIAERAGRFREAGPPPTGREGRDYEAVRFGVSASSSP